MVLKKSDTWRLYRSNISVLYSTRILMSESFKTPSVLVVTPTYNERENIGKLVQKIFDLKIPNLRIMIIDDNSPDGTGELAEELTKKYPLKVFHRPAKGGLGTAYREVFKNIRSRRESEKPNYIIHLDADLSHDPKIIPEMLKRMKDYDLVIGSRYVAGGRIENWNFWRKLLSRSANNYARRVLSLPYYDLTTGFKCYRREIIDRMNLELLSSIGYSFLIESTYLAHALGARIVEIPITFTERKLGTSKLDLKIILESFNKVFKLRFLKK